MSLRVLVCCLLALFLAGHQLHAKKEAPKLLPQWAKQLLDEPVSEEFPDADSIVLLDERQIEVRDGRRAGQRHWMLKVLTEDGIPEAKYRIYRGMFRDFSKLNVWVRDPEGEVDHYSEEDGSLWALVDLQLLDDDSVWLIEPLGIRPGSIVAVENSFTFTKDILQDRFRIQRFMPVWKMRLAVRAEGDWRVEPRVFGGANPGPQEATAGGEWVFEKVAPLKRSKARYAPVPPGLKITFEYFPGGGQSSFPDWGSTAKWNVSQFNVAEDEQGSELIRDTVEQLRSSGEDPVAAAGRLVRELRYFGVEIGWGGYRPRPAGTTLSRKFGDCKDKSFLMVRLLKELGVEAVPVLVMSPDDGYVARELPGPLQFNHCIVGIPWEDAETSERIVVVDNPGRGALRLFDPTLSHEFPGDISPHLEGGRGLAVEEQAVDLLEIPRTPASANQVISRFDATLGAQGLLELEVQRELIGAEAYDLWEDGQVMTPEQLRRETTDDYAPHYPGFTGLEVSRPELRQDGTWFYQFSCTEPDALADFGEFQILHLHPLAGLWNFPVPDEDEPETLYQAYLSRELESWTIKFPGLELVSGPQEIAVNNSLGSVALTWQHAGSQIRFEREFVAGEIDVPPEKRDEARALQIALRQVNRISVVFKASASN